MDGPTVSDEIEQAALRLAQAEDAVMVVKFDAMKIVFMLVKQDLTTPGGDPSAH